MQDNEDAYGSLQDVMEMRAAFNRFTGPMSKAEANYVQDLVWTAIEAAYSEGLASGYESGWNASLTSIN